MNLVQSYYIIFISAIIKDTIFFYVYIKKKIER